jgi:hypothetical protein
MLDLAAIELEYDLLTERSTDQEYADVLQNIPDLIARVRELETDPRALLKVRVQTGNTVVYRLLIVSAALHRAQNHRIELEDCQDPECVQNVDAVIIARRELAWCGS